MLTATTNGDDGRYEMERTKGKEMEQEQGKVLEMEQVVERK